MAIWVAMVAALVELAVAGAIYVSVVAPERAPLGIWQVPLRWRLGLLFCLSILCGAVLQLAGVIHRSH